MFTIPWIMHRQFINRTWSLLENPKRKLFFLGMNPGTFWDGTDRGSFWRDSSVRDWMGLRGEVSKPSPEHTKRPVEGLDCKKSEVSGRRLWGLFAERFESAEAFF